MTHGHSVCWARQFCQTQPSLRAKVVCCRSSQARDCLWVCPVTWAPACGNDARSLAAEASPAHCRRATGPPLGGLNKENLVAWFSGIVFGVDAPSPACRVPEPVGLAEGEQSAIRIQLSKYLQCRCADTSSAVALTDLDELDLHELTFIYVTKILAGLGALDHLYPSELKSALVMDR